MSPDRILVICAAGLFGVLTYNFLQPAPQSAQTAVLPAAADGAGSQGERARALETARREEEAERARLAAAIRRQQRERNAHMFNQRYNTDRTPVGSINGETPAPAPKEGFSVVKPALPPGQAGGGFREVKWGKGQQ